MCLFCVKIFCVHWSCRPKKICAKCTLTAFKIPVVASYNRTWAKCVGKPLEPLFGYQERSFVASVLSSLEYAGIRPKNLTSKKKFPFESLVQVSFRVLYKLHGDCHSLNSPVVFLDAQNTSNRLQNATFGPFGKLCEGILQSVEELLETQQLLHLVLVDQRQRLQRRHLVSGSENIDMVKILESVDERNFSLPLRCACRRAKPEILSRYHQRPQRSIAPLPPPPNLWVTCFCKVSSGVGDLKCQRETLETRHNRLGQVQGCHCATVQNFPGHARRK